MRGVDHLTWAAVLVLVASTAAATDIDITGVQGFVSVSDSFRSALAAEAVAPPDLSSVKVEVLNLQGATLFEGACSPDGYYFVPTDPGKYIVRVSSQNGWSFSPEKAQITCAGGPCNDGADVNFALTGLRLTGYVQPAASAKSCTATSGPQLSGLQFKLTAAGRQLATAVSGARGGFSFSGLLPGQYSVSITDSSVHLQPSAMTHVLDLESTSLPAPFQIAGYTVTGDVSSSSGPVSGIRVKLHSDVPGLAPGCQSQNPPAVGSPLGALCSVTTDLEGRYHFPGVPCGSYSLTAEHPSPGSTFEVAPAQQQLTVGHSDVHVPQPFKVTGFSLQGRVVGAAGEGIEGVTISVNGKVVATSGADGFYTLGRLQQGVLEQVTASKQGYTFSSLKRTPITPGQSTLPDLVVRGVALCGRVKLSDARRPAGRSVQLLSNAGAPEQVVSASSDGTFCFTAAPGSTYTVTPAVSAEETARGFLLSPDSQIVELGSAPEQLPPFVQSTLRIRGSVACLDAGGCPGDIQLQLRREGGGAVALAAKLSEVAVAGGADSGVTEFELQGVAPGGYLLTAGGRRWCWSGGPDGVAVTVASADALAAPLQQVGYELQLRSRYPAEVTVSSLGDAGSPLQSVTLAGGTAAAVCLPGVGQWRVAAESCYLFKGADEDNTFVVDSSGEDVLPPLVLEPAAAVLQGAVEVTGVDVAPPSIAIRAQTTTSGGAVKESNLAATASGRPGQLQYSLLAPIGASVSLQVQAHPLLVYPKLLVVSPVAAVLGGCPAALQAVQVRPGLVLRGATQPPVAGAEVTITYLGRSAASSRGAVGQVADTTSTLADGTFASGALYDDVKYSVTVKQPGYEFAQLSSDPLVFESRKLSQVGVVVDLPPGEDPQQVFLLLSGPAGFKATARLGADQRYAFYNTPPGTYYLRPLLREHSFEPAVATVQVQQGSEPEYRFQAVRTAWGISGVVRSIGGRPLAGVVVEAASGPGAAASGVTDKAGLYRIGSLKPGSYRVAAKLGVQVTSAHPQEIEVELGQADSQGHDFTAFRPSASSSVFAALQLPQRTTQLLTAQLLPAAAASSGGVVASTKVDASGFFELHGVPAGSYVLRVVGDGAGAAAVSGFADTPVEVTGAGDVHLGLLHQSVQPRTSSSSSSRAERPVVGAPEEAGAGVLVQVCAGLGLLVLAVLQKDVLADVFQIGTAVVPISSTAAGVGGSNGSGGQRRVTEPSAGGASRGGTTAASLAAAAATPLEPDEWLPPSSTPPRSAARSRRPQRA